MPGEIELRLYRDSLSTPWGFRLHGGKDLSAPLTVQKVNSGTPSDGELQNGDLILQIQGSDAAKFTHLQAQEQIRKAGGSLLLKIVRYGQPLRTIRSPPAAAEQRVTDWRKPAQEYGVDYTRQQGRIPVPISTQTPPQPGFMLSRVKETLTGVSGTGYGTDPYRQSTPTRLELSPTYQAPSYQIPTAFESSEPPPWAGSLRSSAQPADSDKYIGPHPHNPRVQSVHYAPGESPQYRQHGPQEKHDSQTAYAAHLQYNSPLGLYSKQAAQEALHAQVHGKPGEGTLQIFSESDVQKSVLMEDSGRGHHRAPETDAQFVQSPSLRILESQFAGDSGDIGQSDF